MDLIHKVEGKDVHVMTTPLITKADGSKFGKSEGGAIWLDPEMLSPYEFYQFWLGAEDADVVRFLKVFTFLSREEIEALAVEVAERPHKREAQKALAAEVTRLVHGQEALDQVLAATAALWGSGDLRSVDGKILKEATAHLPNAEVEIGKTNLVDLLIAAGFEKGRGAAMRTIKNGGAYLNNQKVTDPDRTISSEDVLPGSLVLFRKGKRNLAVAYLQK